MAPREEVIQSAVRFLQNPKVQESSLTKRVAFLESKGLTNEEVQIALQRSGSSSGNAWAVDATAMQVQSVPAQAAFQMQHGTMMPGPPQPQLLTWKDYALGAIGVAGAGYGLYSLISAYILPYIIPTTDFLTTSTQELDTHVTASSNVLTSIQSETAAVMSAVRTQSANVTKTLDEMQATLGGVKESTTKRDVALKVLRTDIETLHELVPQMLDKQTMMRAAQISDLQNEFKSLKSLLLNRPIPTGAPSAAPVSDNAPSRIFSGNSPSSTPNTSKGFPFLTNKPIIPAWQLAQQQQKSGESDSGRGGHGQDHLNK
ncbi:peroxisomal membrane anchor protein conserved region-domain-containing protein [Gaertneriomyces semiglobifer]|nr:peroxisomal membrane anchor protein conserved region-domain-containing protein [Gaertneriomyces semiglobifer]